MENASEALIMAGEVLIFIIALTVCISSFSTLRANIDEIIGETETVEMAKGTTGYANYITSKEGGATRTVGSETVVTSMYRAVKEDYVIYIKLNDYNGLSNITYTTATKTQQVATSSGTTNIINTLDKIIKITIGSNQSISAILNGGLYDKIKGASFTEYLGEYQNNTVSGVTSENKKTYRIITYIQQ